MQGHRAYLQSIPFLVACLSCLLPAALSGMEHYYLDVGEDRIAVGVYGGGNFRKQELWSGPPEQAEATRLAHLLTGSADTLLVYFHSFLGNQPQYHHRVLRSFDRLTCITRTITVSWRTGTLNYTAAWKRAGSLGTTIAPILHHFATADRTVHVLCHSMGHRVFEGVLAAQVHGKDMRFGSVLLAAADLDTDSFATSMNRLPGLSRQIVIYTHQMDFMLLTATIVWQKPRLGRCRNVPNKCAGIEVIDIGSGLRTTLSDPSGHVYFLLDPAVRRDIAQVLRGAEEERRQYLEPVKEGYYRLR